LDTELYEFFPKAQASLFQPEVEQRRGENPQEIALEAVVDQNRQFAQTIARSKESEEAQTSHVVAENEAADRLSREFHPYDLAVGLVDMARRCVDAEQNNAELEASLAELQHRIQALERA